MGPSIRGELYLWKDLKLKPNLPDELFIFLDDEVVYAPQFHSSHYVPGSTTGERFSDASELRFNWKKVVGLCQKVARRREQDGTPWFRLHTVDGMNGRDRMYWLKGEH